MRIVQFIIGFIMLAPGICGSFFLAVSLADTIGVYVADSYALLMFLMVSTPSIQIGCRGMWIIARESNKLWVFTATNVAGWFGAAAVTFFVIRYGTELFRHSPSTAATIGLGLFGLAIAIIPFLFGGLPAIRVKQHIGTGE